MLHTPNLTNLGDSPTGMTFLATIEGLLLVFRVPKRSAVGALVEGVDETEIRPSEVELRARLHISMWRTSQASRLSTTRRPLLAEVDLLGRGGIPEGIHLLGAKEANLVVVSTIAEAVSAAAAQEEDGGIGKRFLLFRCYFFAQVTMLIYIRIIGRVSRLWLYRLNGQCWRKLNSTALLN